MEKDKKISTEDLAVMVQKGFEDVKEYMDKRFNKLENRQDILEKGQEEILVKLDQKVHKFEHKELEFRVEKLEKKAGIA